MSNRCFKIAYTDFGGRKIVKAWRAKNPCQIRMKALNQCDCQTPGVPQEISEDEFQQLTAHKPRAKMGIRNRKTA